MKKKVRLTEVQPIADKLIQRLSAHCERIAVAGSIRRLERWVGDIEIVAIPKVDRLVAPSLLPGAAPVEVAQVNHLFAFLDQLAAAGYITVAVDGRRVWGDRQRKFLLATKQGRSYKVDLFLCQPENWGNALLIRTGPADFSQFMVTSVAKGGVLPAGMVHRDNRLYRDGIALDIGSEIAFFEAVGLPFVPVEDRGKSAWKVGRGVLSESS